jgi:hypothetical protein
MELLHHRKLCEGMFWLEHPSDLVCSINIIPSSKMTLSSQMNAITRLVILLALCVCIFNIKAGLIFGIISLVFIIIIYYIQRRHMNKHKNTVEHYQNSSYTSTKCNLASKLPNIAPAPIHNNMWTQPKMVPKRATPMDLASLVDSSGNIPRSLSNLWCNDEVLLAPNENFYSLNQNLVGPANPKTLIPPVVIAPPAALDYWRANNLINHSHINTESQFDTYLSGYEVSNCCDNVNGCLVPAQNPSQPSCKNKDVRENYQIGDGVYRSKGNSQFYEGVTDDRHPIPKRAAMRDTKIVSPTPVVALPYSRIVNNTSENITLEGSHENYEEIEPYESGPSYGGIYGKNNYRDQLPSKPIHSGIVSPTPTVAVPWILQEAKKDYKENFENDRPRLRVPRKNDTGWMDDENGYYPQQAYDSNIPANEPVGTCERDPKMKQYNKNLYTQNIGPDTYTTNEIIEPINANIGISFTQQFEPLSAKRDNTGLHYTEHDPRLYNPEVKKEEWSSVSESTVYDPRFSGYGTSYRAYNEEVTGQPRFYYDDVESVRMPNYISRSNIDFANYADSYGPLSNKNQYGNVNTDNIRALAQDTFLRSSIQFREDIMERTMRKRNAELHQTRKYPKISGGMSR